MEASTKISKEGLGDKAKMRDRVMPPGVVQKEICNDVRLKPKGKWSPQKIRNGRYIKS